MAAIQAYSPYNGTASNNNIHLYQQIIRSLNYAAIATRPDIAKISSHLASFMTNPGPDHFITAYQVLAYLNHTQQMGLKYSAKATEPSETSSYYPYIYSLSSRMTRELRMSAFLVFTFFLSDSLYRARRTFAFI